MPTLKEEKKLWRRGYRYVLGLDEAGRGAICGPVVAVALMIRLKRNQKLKTRARDLKILKEIKDSKKISPKVREKFYKVLINHPRIKWGIGMVSEKVIDRINILEATKLAMIKAINNLFKKNRFSKQTIERILKTKTFLILDGDFHINNCVPQKAIVKADEKVVSCAAASILAKVSRDRMMFRYHKKYPEYKLDLHKGYPTELHRKMIRKYGPSAIHRLTFNIKNLK